MAEIASEHALHIAVDRRNGLAEGDAGNSCRGVDTHSRQAAQSRRCPWNFAPVLGNHSSRRLVQRPGAPVVAKPAPQSQHFCFFGLGQRLERGKPRQEAGVIVDHDGDAGLLQHGL